MIAPIRMMMPQRGGTSSTPATPAAMLVLPRVKMLNLRSTKSSRSISQCDNTTSTSSFGATDSSTRSQSVPSIDTAITSPPSTHEDHASNQDVWQVLTQIKLQYAAAYQLRGHLEAAFEVLTSVADWQRTSSISALVGTTDDRFNYCLLQLICLDRSTSFRRPRACGMNGQWPDRRTIDQLVAESSPTSGLDAYRHLKCQDELDACGWITATNTGVSRCICKPNPSVSIRGTGDKPSLPFCRIHQTYFKQVLLEADAVSQQLMSQLVSLASQFDQAELHEHAKQSCSICHESSRSSMSALMECRSLGRKSMCPVCPGTLDWDHSVVMRAGYHTDCVRQWLVGVSPDRLLMV